MGCFSIKKKNTKKKTKKKKQQTLKITILKLLLKIEDFNYDNKY